MDEGALEVEHLSLRELRVGNLEGGLLYWGPWRICRKGPGDGQSVSIGALLGNLEGGSLTRDFERWMKVALEEERLSLRELCEGDPEGESFTGEPGGYVEKGMETGVSRHWGPAGENLEGDSFTRDFERRMKEGSGNRS